MGATSMAAFVTDSPPAVCPDPLSTEFRQWSYCSTLSAKSLCIGISSSPEYSRAYMEKMVVCLVFTDHQIYISIVTFDFIDVMNRVRFIDISTQRRLSY